MAGGRPSLLIPCVAAAAQSFAFMNHAPILPPLMRDLALTPASAGLLTTATFVAGGVLSVPLGELTDRVGPKRVTAAAMALLVVSSIMLSLSTSYPVALGSRALAGVSLASVFIAGGGYVNMFWPAERSFLAQGLHGGSIQLGIGLAILVLPAIADAGSWRVALGVSAGVVALVLALWQWRARATPPTTSRPPLSLVLGNRTIWRLGLVHTSTFGLAIVLGTWVAAYLTREFQLPLVTAGMLGSLGLVIGAVGRPLGGVLVARGVVGPRRAILVTLATGIGALLLIAWPERPLVIAVAGLLLAGVAAAFSYAPVVALATRAAPSAPAAALGLIGLVATPGVIVGAPLVGALLSASGGFALPFAVLALLPATTLALSLGLPRDR
jgi:NNP family nitrate/nitrite transporter-like MFS transporter